MDADCYFDQLVRYAIGHFLSATMADDAHQDSPMGMTATVEMIGLLSCFVLRSWEIRTQTMLFAKVNGIQL